MKRNWLKAKKIVWALKYHTFIVTIIVIILCNF